MSFILEKTALDSLINALQKKGYEVYGPVQKGPEFAFSKINKAKDLSLDYVTTIMSPRKYLYQNSERLFSFNAENFTIKETSNGTGKKAILGVHACDLHAILLLDRVRMSGAFDDPKYKALRDNTLLIGLNCSSSGDQCFCTSMEAGPGAEQGYDILLTDLGNRYIVEVGTDSGKSLLADLKLKRSSPSDIEEKARKIEDVKASIKRHINKDELPMLLDKNFNHEIWAKLKEDCFSCGACTTVCPTCYCFNVVDNVDFSLKNGERIRNLDSCQLVEFGQVALGGNFRKERDARIKQWIYHKMNYFPVQYGGFGCVGCGRCIKSCTKGIDVTDVIHTIRGD